jgi:hypothetical protein
MAESFASNEPGSPRSANHKRRRDVTGPISEINSFDSSGNKDNASLPGMVSKGKMINSLASSSVPPSHLQGLQFVDIHRTEGQPRGAYFHDLHGVSLHGFGKDSVSSQGQRARTPIHEIGHHVDSMTNGTPDSLGKSEALAENYADANASVSASSVYDAHLHRGLLDPFKTASDTTGDVNAIDYENTREAGSQPDQPRSSIPSAWS